jgi:hypothetical protein
MQRPGDKGDDRFCNRIAAVEPVFPMTFKLNFRLSTLPVRDWRPGHRSRETEFVASLRSNT